MALSGLPGTKATLEEIPRFELSLRSDAAAREIAPARRLSMKILACRSCNSPLLHVVLDLGEHPISNGLLNSKDEMRREKRYPLQVALCEECSLLQVTETIPP